MLSFTSQVKQELCRFYPHGRDRRIIQAYGMFAFAREYSPEAIRLTTESESTALRYCEYLDEFAGADKSQLAAKNIRGRRVYHVNLAEAKDRKALIRRMVRFEGELAGLLSGQGSRGAFLSGVFLVCGSVVHPQKGYHLEFALGEQPLAEGLLELLDKFLPGASLSKRRGGWLVYYKDRGQVQDMLALMGAGKASLDVIEVEMLNEVRNRAMRITNCETANIDKTVQAASEQIQDIKIIMENRDFGLLPKDLQAVAIARLKDPEFSIRELAANMQPPISYSAVYRRFEKLKKLAEQTRAEGQITE